MILFARWMALTIGVAYILQGRTPELTAQQVSRSAPPPDTSPAFPTIKQYWTPTTPVVPYTAAEWNHGAGIYRQQAVADQPPDVLVYPQDSILAATSTVVREWLQTLRAGEVRGMQLDSYGTLHVISGQDDAARRILAERLTMPGMTLSDSAFTLSTAVQAFADADKPTRFPIAEEYMTHLDALPKGGSDIGVSIWQFEAHRILSRAYFLAGDAPSAIVHAKQAIATIPNMFFGSRRAFYSSRGSLNMYLTLASLLLRSNDRGTLRTIDQQLLAWTTPPDSLVVKDSSFVSAGRGYAAGIRRIMSLVAMLGQSAPTVEGSSWLNVADTGAHEMRLNDGMVRIIGIGSQGSGLSIIPAFERLITQFKTGFQPIFLTVTQGYWGTEFVTPAQESANLRHYFTHSRLSKIPVAIWAGEKVRTPYGGMLPTPSPTVQAFRAPRLPFVALIDQHGIIHQVFMSFGREEEEQATSAIRMLLGKSDPTGERS